MFLKDAIKAVVDAGEIIKENFTKNIKYEEKDKGEIVTEIDRKVENFIYERLKKYGYNFEGEEFGLIKENSDYKIILDPIDGTTNFFYKIGFFNTALALEHNNEIILGIVYNPLTKELYYAEKDKGAFYNFEKIYAKEFEDLNKAIMGFCYGKDERDLMEIMRIYQNLRPKVKEMRRFGSANLEIVYSINKFHGFIGIGLKPYDFKAAVLIAREAGLMVKDKIISKENDILVIRKGLDKKINKIIH